MVKKNPMENVTFLISMVIEKLNTHRNQSLKESVTITINKDTDIQSAKPRNGT